MFSPKIQKLIDLFSKFPTIGPKTAARFVFYLLKIPDEKIKELSEAIIELKEKIKTCEFCFTSFEAETGSDSNICSICSSGQREKSKICAIEKEIDLEAIENSHKYKGLYFILGGTMGFKSEKPKEILEERIEKIVQRIKNPASGEKIEEVILAFNPNHEGENTALLMERRLKGLPVKITRLGRGLPIGGELEYADEETISSAFEGRK